MKHAALLLVAILLLTSCGGSSFDRVSSEAESLSLARRFADEIVYEELLVLLPQTATRHGVHTYDSLLNDPSPAGDRKYKEFLESSLERLAKIPVDARQNDLEYDLVKLWLETELDGTPYRGITFLLDPLHGFQLELPKLIGEMPYRREGDYRAALDRLAKIPAYVDGVIASLRADGEAGRWESRVVVEKVLSQLDAQLEMEPQEHPFVAPFQKAPDRSATRDRIDFRGRALALLSQNVLPAWKKFRDFLADEYLAKARVDAGIWATSNGAERYRWCVKHYTTTDLSADEIHEIGLKEVARIRAEMEKIREQVGFEGDLQAFFDHLRTDPKFYFTEPEDLLRGYRDICKRADAALPSLFGKLPRAPYGVIPIPDYAAKSATTAFYNVPPADGRRPGYFYANTYKLEMRPKYEMEALALHEAVPGHHLQLALQLELENVSKFRSRWLEFTAFVEGWGLYSELLGREMGFYTDPYSDFGRLTYEMWRACRLVVDTGMHHKRWTRRRAIDFMLANSALTRLNVESEIDRYITWPGQALAYKIGELKIRELRARAEKALGDEFDVRAFHDTLLEEGSIPLSLLEKRIDAWIAARK